ncbi:HepT-like ribonuclease domain-containing protein [Priestia megaterium]|uniref:HepT-like ribonuclease domain-containing protein n=1 Tax=Priestia megaterium TaxID=1404 RepID=UPI0015D4DC56|nr:HepT-like ribonuclease domain-containing protein [Priestia megaterium]
MKRSEVSFLKDIIKHADKIRAYLGGLEFYEFEQNERLVDVILRNFEIIGEACDKVTQKTKDENPHIPWRNIKGMRNMIVHEYWNVDLKIIWNVYEQNLDGLQRDINHIIDHIIMTEQFRRGDS